MTFLKDVPAKKEDVLWVQCPHTDHPYRLFRLPGGIVLLLCVSCYNQLKGEILSDLVDDLLDKVVKEALHGSQKAGHI
jgi:hypothetical protein